MHDCSIRTIYFNLTALIERLNVASIYHGPNGDCHYIPASVLVVTVTIHHACGDYFTMYMHHGEYIICLPL